MARDAAVDVESFRIDRSKQFDSDVATLVKDPVQRSRVLRRVKKLGANPAHHGYHAGDLLRCNWVAGVGDWAIIYEIHEQERSVRLLRLVELPL